MFMLFLDLDFAVSLGEILVCLLKCLKDHVYSFDV